MRLRATLLAILFAAPAGAAPLVTGRVGMIARGQLPTNILAVDQADTRARVTVRVDGGASVLQQAGFDAQPLVGDVAQVRANAADLRRLLGLPGVRAVEERRLLRPQLDQSAAFVGAPAARAESGFDGSGVLVGVVDTGLDFRHDDFRHDDGSTRVAALLDVAHPRGDLHPELPAYAGGALWLREDIDAVLSAEAAGQHPARAIVEADDYGHGTHVTGIAASNGRATGHGWPAGRYVGIAPGADLVIAQASHSGNMFSDADVIDCTRFVVEQAQRIGRPVVVNLSIGGAGGPHDGSSNFERSMDALFPPDGAGRILVVSAGNAGSQDQHAGAWSLEGERAVPVALPGSSATGQLAVEIYYAGTVSLSVESPLGKRVGPVTLGNSLDTAVGSEGLVTVDNGTSGVTTGDGRQSAALSIRGLGTPSPAAGTWKLILNGQSIRWDAWITDTPPAATTRFTDLIAEDDRLALPATARNAIVVGSVISRNQWNTVDGQTIGRSIVIGEPSTFSSTGPTVDGRFSPDVLAPGESILSALSRDATPDRSTSAFYTGPSSPTYAWADDGVHGVLRGTSQAAPHVTGAVALLLQANPMLTPNGAREILRVTARAPASGYSPRYGFGTIDVLAALRFIAGKRASQPDAALSSVGVNRDFVPPGDQAFTVTVTPRGSDGVPLGPGHQVSIGVSAGQPMGDVVDAGFGRYERTFLAHGSRGTVASIVATVDAVVLAAHPSVAFVPSRSELGRPFLAAGGCSLARQPGARAGYAADGWLPASLGLLLVGALLWLAIAARRRSRAR